MSISERVANAWGVPENLTMDTPQITMNADREVYVENHKGIISFSEDSVLLAYKGGNLAVYGSALGIKYMNSDAVLIKGRIKSVEFQ